MLCKNLLILGKYIMLMQKKSTGTHMVGSDLGGKGKRRAVTPNAITAFGLCCGLFIIFKSVLRTSSSSELFHRLQGLSLLLISAMIADFSDGAVARIMKAESAFGAQFDSLSDAITFGIAPPLIAIKSLNGFYVGGFFSSLLVITSIIYSLCGVLRLVRYNLFSKSPNTSRTVGCFIGLPIPAAAASVVSLALFLVSDNAASVSANVRSFLLSCALLFIGGLMISPWKFPSIKTFRYRVSSFLLAAITGVIACLLFLGLVDYFVEVFLLISWLYVLVIFPIFTITYVKKRKVKMTFTQENVFFYCFRILFLSIPFRSVFHFMLLQKENPLLNSTNSTARAGKSVSSRLFKFKTQSRAAH